MDISDICTFMSYESLMITLIIDLGQVQEMFYSLQPTQSIVNLTLVSASTQIEVGTFSL